MDDKEFESRSKALAAEHDDKSRLLLIERYGKCELQKGHFDAASFFWGMPYGAFLGFLFAIWVLYMAGDLCKG